MAADKKLSSFKVSSTQRPTVARPSKKEAPAPPSFSVGYEKIEKLLEAEDPGELVKGLQASLDKLQHVHDEAGTPKEKSAALRAIRAYELTLDLVEFLFRTKDSLQQPGAAT